MPATPSSKEQPEADVVYASPMKMRGKNVLVGVLSGILVIVIGIFGAYLILYGLNPGSSSSPTSSTKVSTPSSKPATPSSQKDETVGWKTYTSSKYSYSIRYPGDWPISEASNGSLLLNQTSKKAQLTEEELSRPTMSIYQEEFTCSSNYKNCKLIGEVLVGGKKWEKSTYEDFDGNRQEVYFYNNEKLQIFTSPHNQQDLINKILSTFRFD